MLSIKDAVAYLKSGDVIIVPTEAVYGLSCDAKNEEAVGKLLHLKNRPNVKGLIVAISDLSQIDAWLKPLSKAQKAKLSSLWPGPVTVILPAYENAPKYLTGDHGSLAVRMSAHPILSMLTSTFGPIVTTSANLTGHPAVKSVDQLFNLNLPLVKGELGGLDNPTRILDLKRNEFIR